MCSDVVLRHNAMNILTKGLGLVEAERFVYLVKSEKFDYTEWRQNLWEDMTLKEVFEYCKRLEIERGKYIPPTE
ncbi:MAG: hypothetical protein LBE35_03325 [Clostridiales bacterium]|jgi:hypothetical protein|nr:hypothetical protein [Clostridiales bacterium]